MYITIPSILQYWAECGLFLFWCHTGRLIKSGCDFGYEMKYSKLFNLTFGDLVDNTEQPSEVVF